MIRLIDDVRYMQKVLHLVALGCCLIFVFFFRHNGVIPYWCAFIFIIIYALVQGIKTIRMIPADESKLAHLIPTVQKFLPLITCVVISLACILLIKGPIYSALKVQETQLESTALITVGIHKEFTDNFGFAQTPNALKDFISNTMMLKDKSQITATLFTRIGLYLVLSLVLLIYLWNIRKIKTALFIPMAGNVLSFVVSMTTQEYRYAWFVFVISWFIFLYCLTCSNVKDSEIR